MALLKRRKRQKHTPLQPRRQILCYSCGSPVLTDGGPVLSDDEPHPPYTCPNCGKSYPETQGQRAARHRELEESMGRADVKREEMTTRKAKGLPLIWTVPGRVSPDQRKATRGAKESREREINEILSKDFRPVPAGRKPDSAYDRADYRLEVAKISGKKIPMADLTRQILPADKSGEEYKVDKLTQALKRRRRKR
jgi:hypothetical protein